jgi:hypothetical protein
MRNVLVIIMILACICIAGCTGTPPKEYHIYSFDVVTGASNNFTLGSKQDSDGDLYYLYYVKDTDGAYHQRESMVESSRLFKNTTSDTAYVIVFNCISNPSEPACGGYSYGYDFYIPPDTIIMQSGQRQPHGSGSSDSSKDFTTRYIATQYLNPSSGASPMHYGGIY